VHKARNITIAALALEPSALTLEVGKNSIFRVVAKDSRGQEIQVPNLTYAWSTNNGEVIKVDKSGFVDGLRVGTATVIIKYENLTTTAKVTVIAPLGLTLYRGIRTPSHRARQRLPALRGCDPERAGQGAWLHHH
jgi:hypothetical protein